MARGKDSSVRVRFAPSPTGYLHIGNFRTALFNWLFAHHHNGTFLIRIEDTDKERSRKEYVDAILQALEWTDIQSSEKIVYQSENIGLHKKMIEKLLQDGKAYKCYCPAKEAVSSDDYFKYDGRCRTNSSQHPYKDSYVVRIKLPLDQKIIAFYDLIRGPVSFPMSEFDDFIIARSDGSPVYNFVVVVDDHAMNISHVLRGEDHISNTPKQIILYNALGFDVPQFGHFPLILGASGGKLSKRDAATSVLDYKKGGYLANAFCNYLVRLGWAHGDQEIFSRKELIDLFTLDGIGISAAVFDIQKLNWFNGVYIRKTPSEELLNLIIRDVDSDFLQQVSDWNTEQIIELIDLYKERVETLCELIDELGILYNQPDLESVDSELMHKWITADSASYVAELAKELESITFDTQTIKKTIKDFCKEKNIKLPLIAQPIRLALLGKTNSPGIFEIMAVMKKNVVLKRIENLIHFLQKNE